MAFVAARVADEAAHGVDGRQVALEPALHPLLLVLDGVPCEEDEEEAEELEAGGEAEVDEAQGGDVVLPAGAVDAAVLLPQHAGGVDDGAEVNGCRDVGWVQRREKHRREEEEREEKTREMEDKKVKEKKRQHGRREKRENLWAQKRSELDRTKKT